MSSVWETSIADEIDWAHHLYTWGEPDWTDGQDPFDAVLLPGEIEKAQTMALMSIARSVACIARLMLAERENARNVEP